MIEYKQHFVFKVPYPVQADSDFFQMEEVTDSFP